MKEIQWKMSETTADKIDKILSTASLPKYEKGKNYLKFHLIHMGFAGAQVPILVIKQTNFDKV